MLKSLLLSTDIETIISESYKLMLYLKRLCKYFKNINIITPLYSALKFLAITDPLFVIHFGLNFVLKHCYTSKTVTFFYILHKNTKILAIK